MFAKVSSPFCFWISEILKTCQNSKVYVKAVITFEAKAALLICKYVDAKIKKQLYVGKKIDNKNWSNFNYSCFPFLFHILNNIFGAITEI